MNFFERDGELSTVGHAVVGTLIGSIISAALYWMFCL